MVNILVTGGAGYIGSHACKALSRAGYTPVTYDSLVNGHDWAVKWGPLERGDIRDRSRLDEVLRRYRPEAVLHFAAYAYVGESVTDPGKYYDNNVAGSLALLEGLRDHGIDTLVFSSTCAVYGVPNAIPIPETHPQEPINPYGASKLMIERMMRDFEVAHGLRAISLRYFNAAGADPDGEIGEAHDPETHLIPLLLEAAAGLGPPVTIFGTDYDTADGTCVRDYIHVSDLADAHVAALNRLRDGAPSAAYNLGLGRGTSVHAVIAAVRRITGRDVPTVEGPRRPGDPAVLVADPAKAQTALDWRPQHDDLDETVQTAWAWQQRNALAEHKPVAKVSVSAG